MDGENAGGVDTLTIIVENNLHQSYISGINDCDHWVEDQVEISDDYSLPLEWNSAERTCYQHIRDMNHLFVDDPESTWSMVLMEDTTRIINEGHCGLLRLNDDDSVTFFECGGRFLESNFTDYDSVNQFENRVPQIYMNREQTSNYNALHYYPLRRNDQNAQ